MSPNSEQLEGFLERIQSLDRDLGKLNGAEVRKAEQLGELKAVSRDWLRLSEGLRAMEALPGDNLAFVDSTFQEVLQSTNVRTRSSAYRKKLSVVLPIFIDKIIVPVIRHEGSPTQVASRQLLAAFAGKVSTDEQGYLEESARCLSSKCNRAAIILLWAAAISRIHSAIEKIGFNTYNLALDQTVQKKSSPFSRVSKSPIASLPELQRSRDFDLIVIGMELWKYDLQVFEELDRLLGIRNSAAHPGMLRPTALDVQQYASKVATYVFDVVPA